jgi:hypothetical protein
MLTSARTLKMHALAHKLRGFGKVTTLRVRVMEIRDGVAFVITADLLDVGTKLALDPNQLEACE